MTLTAHEQALVARRQRVNLVRGWALGVRRSELVVRRERLVRALLPWVLAHDLAAADEARLDPDHGMCGMFDELAGLNEAIVLSEQVEAQEALKWISSVRRGLQRAAW